MRTFVMAAVMGAASACCIRMPEPTPPGPTPPASRPVGPRLTPPTGADWFVPTGASVWPDGTLKVGVGEGVGMRPVASGEGLRSAGGGQGPSTRHLSFNFALTGVDAGVYPLVAMIHLVQGNRLLTGLSATTPFEPVTRDTSQTGELRFIMCPSEAGTALLGASVRIDAHIPVDGGVGPDAGVMARTSAEFIISCSECQDACDG